VLKNGICIEKSTYLGSKEPYKIILMALYTSIFIVESKFAKKNEARWQDNCEICYLP